MDTGCGHFISGDSLVGGHDVLTRIFRPFAGIPRVFYSMQRDEFLSVKLAA